MALHSKIYLDCCLQPRVYGYVTLQCILKVRLLLPFALSDLPSPRISSSLTEELSWVELLHPRAVCQAHTSVPEASLWNSLTMGLVTLSFHFVLTGFVSKSWHYLKSCKSAIFKFISQSYREHRLLLFLLCVCVCVCTYWMDVCIWAFTSPKEDMILTQKTINPFINTNIFISKMRVRFFRTATVPVSSQSISLVVWEKINPEI